MLNKKSKLSSKKIQYKKRKKRKKTSLLRKVTLLIFPLIILLFLFKYYTDMNFGITKSNSRIAEISDDIFTVCLDAGHGDWDIGAIGISNSYEKDINLSVTLKIGALLESSGINIVYTRDSDNLTWSDNSTENLYERVDISKENNCDLFISIHCNSTAESASYNGIETWFNPDSSESEVLSTYIQDELVSLNYTSDRGIKYYSSDATLAVLEHNPAPSALVELGFISNLSDENFLTSKNGQTQIAKAISNAILQYIENL